MLFRSVREALPERRLLAGAVEIAGADRRRHEPGIEVHHHDAAVLRQPLEDGAVTNFVQRGIQGGRPDDLAVVELGGDSIASGENRVTEATIRGFWKGYREVMGL